MWEKMHYETDHIKWALESDLLHTMLLSCRFELCFALLPFSLFWLHAVVFLKGQWHSVPFPVYSLIMSHELVKAHWCQWCGNKTACFSEICLIVYSKWTLLLGTRVTLSHMISFIICKIMGFYKQKDYFPFTFLTKNSWSSLVHRAKMTCVCCCLFYS